MNTASIVRPPSRKQLIISAGRAHLRTWLLAAEAHGTIYYNVQSVSRSGMNRKISLSTIIPYAGLGDQGKPGLVRLWPALREESIPRGAAEYTVALDVIARDWGFSFEARAFNVSGGNMDMVFALVYALAGKALPREDALPYTNKVRREAF
jgi:hypothetical protein